MEDLIKAFQIFAKYSNSNHPTNCEHDVLYVSVSPIQVSEEDISQLKILGFSADFQNDFFFSTIYGSN